MKTVYFVRHGSTPFLEADGGIFQDFDTPLSEKGKAQAEYVAKRFATIPVEIVITSTMTRARETGEAIARISGKELIESELFHELLRPSAMRGKPRRDSETMALWEHVLEIFAHEDIRHSDEENFYDLKARALKALKFLEVRREEKIVVVTHGTFLKMLMSVMMERTDTSPRFFEAIDDFMYVNNTGITKCVYDKYKDGRWILQAWNDDAHLGALQN